MFKLIYLVPKRYLEKTKQAIFKAGAGKIGQYDECCYVTKVQGQFKPNASASPKLGLVNALTKFEECCVDTVCSEACVAAVIAALKQAHPYETLPMQLIKLQ